MCRSSKKDKLLAVLLCLFIFQIICILVYYLPSMAILDPVGRIRTRWLKWKIEEIPSAESIIMAKFKENSCKIPRMDPYNPKILPYFEPLTVDCTRKYYYYYFRSEVEENTDQPLLIMKKNLPSRSRCCYEQLRFTSSNGFRSVTFKNDTCTNITGKRTVIPEDSQYIIINCWNVPKSGEKIQIVHKEILFYIPKLKLPTKAVSQDKLNVIIMGFDQISRLNFIRLMGNTFQYLKSELGAIDLQGYNKVGDATLNNTLAFMTGYMFGEFKKNPKWWKGKRDDSTHNTFFDDGPWIWKNFSEKGYLTVYGDDYPSVFDFRFNGFRKQPTDYYLHPFINWYMGRWVKFGNTYDCIGDDPALHLLQDLTRKVSRTLRNHPYFHFMWNSRIHEKPGYPSLADNATLTTLKYMEKTGALNKSLVVLLSDHGWRVGPVMEDEQGRLENRMPFAFLLLPKWFRKEYALAYANLQENQYRLTTPYDIHQTLLDILNYKEELNDQRIENRKVYSKKKGMTLFLPISKERTCEQAGIDETWCVCSSYIQLTNYSLASKLAQFAVATINSWLIPFKRCQQYKLDQILRAEVQAQPIIESSSLSISNLKTIQTFRVALSMMSLEEHEGPQFEVTIFLDERLSKGDKGSMRMSTEIFRLNQYGNSSECIDVYSLKKICTCTR